MGTPSPWQLIPTGNRIFLKPIEDDASTNMTVVTNKRMYFFEMHAEEAFGLEDENLNFVVKFIYPEDITTYNVIGDSQSNVNVPKIAKTPDFEKKEIAGLFKGNAFEEDIVRYNFKYSISGPSNDIEPLLIFDDMRFTYFKFKDLNAELPAIFLVDKRGNEGLINYRMLGDYLVVERVAKQFTLRHGGDVLCIFNDRY